MAAVRRNITANATDAGRFVQAVQALKAESAGIRTSEVGIAGGPLAADRPLSTWDLFVIWHVWAMQQISSDGRRNAAHMGPVFLPWHRWFLLVIEANMQRVLGVSRDDFGLPYWDWAADGTNLTPAQQRTGAAVWQIIGGNGRASDRQVVDGPFVQASFDVRVEQGPSGALRATNRGLRRNFGVDTSRLPAAGGPRPDAGQRHLRPRRLGHQRLVVPQHGGRLGPRRAGDAQPCPRVGGRRHGARLLAQRPRLLPEPLLRRPGVVDLAGGRPDPRLPADRTLDDDGSAVPAPPGDPIYSILTRNQPSVESMLRVDSFYTYA